MSVQNTLSHDLLLDRLIYEPDTGVFRWRRKRKPRSANALAGYLDPKGYWYVRVERTLYAAARLAWFYVHGKWPDGEIDHINRDSKDNRIVNLRDVSRTVNVWNTGLSSRNTSGYQGVYWCAQRRKYRARIKRNGKMTDLGFYESAKQAGEAYLKAKHRHDQLPSIAA